MMPHGHPSGTTPDECPHGETLRGIQEHLTRQDQLQREQAESQRRVESAIIGNPYRPEVPCLMNKVTALETQVESLLRTRRQQAKLLWGMAMAIATAAGTWVWSKLTGSPKP